MADTPINKEVIDAAFSWERKTTPPVQGAACSHIYLLIDIDYNSESEVGGRFVRVYCARCLNTKKFPYNF